MNRNDLIRMMRACDPDAVVDCYNELGAAMRKAVDRSNAGAACMALASVMAHLRSWMIESGMTLVEANDTLIWLTNGGDSANTAMKVAEVVVDVAKRSKRRKAKGV